MASEPRYQDATPTSSETPSHQESYFSTAGRYANSIWNVVKPNTFCKALGWCSTGTITLMGGGYLLLQASQHQNVGVNLALGILLTVPGALELSVGLVLPKQYADEAERNETTRLMAGVNP